MTMRTVSFEVDTIKLFDSLKKLNGDMSHIGQRVVGALLAEPVFVELLGMAVYGVVLLPHAAPLLAEQPEGSSEHAS